MQDLTVVTLLAQKTPEVWNEIFKEKLLEAVDGALIITVSYKPVNWGLNILQVDYSILNVYVQMLRAFELAETPYVAMADDDTLYPKEHFRYRPEKQPFAYNMTRWHLFSWGDPIYFYKPLPGNGLFIGDRLKSIKALKARLASGHAEEYHELGTRRSTVEMDGGSWERFYTTDPVVSFYHEGSIDKANQRRRKKMWPVRAYDLPVWGRVEDVRELWR